MKVTIAKKDLAEALGRLMPAVAVKPQTPILSGIYLKAEGITLQMRATNFTQEISATIPANVEVAGAVVVGGKMLNMIVAKLGGEIVTLTEGNNRLAIKSDAAKFELPTFDAEDFPAEQKLDWDFAARYKIAEFKERLKSITTCAGKDVSRPIFTGVQFSQVGAELTLTATNTHRIGRARLKSFDEGEMCAIIPAEVCGALISSLEGELVTLSVNRNRARFEYENFMIMATLIEGRLPSVDTLYNAPKSRRAMLDVADMKSALGRIGVIAQQSEYTQFFLTFTADGLELRASAQDVGEATEHIDVDLEGGALEIAFNIKYVGQVLYGLSTQKVIVEMNAELEPALFKGEGDEDLAYVITPVRTR